MCPLQLPRACVKEGNLHTPASGLAHGSASRQRLSQATKPNVCAVTRHSGTQHPRSQEMFTPGCQKAADVEVGHVKFLWRRIAPDHRRGKASGSLHHAASLAECAASLAECAFILENSFSHLFHPDASPSALQRVKPLIPAKISHLLSPLRQFSSPIYFRCTHTRKRKNSSLKNLPINGKI